MAGSVLEIYQEFDYINREIDDIYFQYNTLLLKHVKYLFLKIIMNAKQNICFWLKKYSSNAIW